MHFYQESPPLCGGGWGRIADHADQTVRSGNAPYRKDKIIYCVCIGLFPKSL